MDRNIPTFYENTGFKFNRKKTQTVTLYLNNSNINSDDGTFDIELQDALKIDKLSDLYLDSFSTSYFKSNTGIILNPVAPAAAGDSLSNRDSEMTGEQRVLSLGNQLPLQVSGVDSSAESFDVGEKVTYYHKGLSEVDDKSILHYNSEDLKITIDAKGVAAVIDLDIRDGVLNFKDFADINVGNLVKLTVNTDNHLAFTGGAVVQLGQVFRVLTKPSPNITLAFIGSDTPLVFDSITGGGIGLGEVVFELYSEKIDTEKDLYIKEKDNSNNYKFSATPGGELLKIAGGHEDNILIRIVTIL